MQASSGSSGGMIFSIEMLPTLSATNSAVPTGGVVSPNDRLITMISPRCTRLMSNFSASGSSIGTSMISAGVMSTNMPTTSRNPLRISRNAHLLWIRLKKFSASMLGRFS